MLSSRFAEQITPRDRRDLDRKLLDVSAPESARDAAAPFQTADETYSFSRRLIRPGQHGLTDLPLLSQVPQ